MPALCEHHSAPGSPRRAANQRAAPGHVAQATGLNEAPMGDALNLLERGVRGEGVIP